MPSVNELSYQMGAKLSARGALAKALLSKLRSLWAGLAEEFGRIYERVAAMIVEAHPSTCDETLEQWEVEYDLPDPCVTSVQTVDDRRSAVQSRALNVGGQSRTYFVELAAGFGIPISIIEEKPFLCGLSGMGDGIGGDDFAFTWSVNAPASTTLAQRQLLECTFQRLKPAYTEVQFFYI